MGGYSLTFPLAHTHMVLSQRNMAWVASGVASHPRFVVYIAHGEKRFEYLRI